MTQPHFPDFEGWLKMVASKFFSLPRNGMDFNVEFTLTKSVAKIGAPKFSELATMMVFTQQSVTQDLDFEKSSLV